MNAESGYLLIVEDDPDILKLLETTLKYSGYHVISARNGDEGLEVILRERPAIVIADIMMPKLDGFGLVHRMRLNPETQDIPVVFITATYVSPEDKEFAFSAGATHFIQKPINFEKFLKTIAELEEQGAPVTLEPLDEFNFYEGYRIRLEAKLAQIEKHIARDEFLLGTKSDEGDPSMQVSLHRAKCQRDELKLLLDQVYEQLTNYSNPE
jgi:DNA-binding response OmpR family regulator